MLSDSSIIHYTTRSLSHDSVSTTAGSITEFSLNNEIRSFCCVCSHLTIKSCKFHSLKVFLILLSLMALFTSMIQGGYMSAVLTSLQIQFNMSTSKIGIILSSFDIMNLFATPLVSYFGSRYNKAKIIAVCSLIYAFGCIVFTFPYFFSDKYTVYGNNSDILLNTTYDACKSITTNIATATKLYLTSISTSFNNNNNNTQTQTCSVRSDDWPYYIFIVGQLLMSWGTAPLFSLGITYLTENTEEKYHAFYTGIVYGAYALGPALGYLLASYFLSKWLYLSESAPINLTQNDKKWIGAWYLGFIVSCVCILLVSLLLITFPSRIQRSMLIFENSKTNNNAKSNKKTKQTSKLDTIEEDNELNDNNIKKEELIIDTISSQVTTATAASSATTSSSIDTITTNSDSNSNSTSQSMITNNIDSTKSLNNNNNNNNEIIESSKSCCCSTFWCNLFNLKIKGFLTSFLQLIINFRYALLIIIMSIECILISIFTHYLVIYTQNVYQMSSSTSSILVGGIIVPPAIIGAIAGGFIVRKYDLFIEGCTRLIMLSSTLVVAGICVLLFIRCDATLSFGIDSNTQTIITNSSCNLNCNCSSTDYNPVCGIDRKTYVSPCIAGCASGNLTSFFNCNCINNVNKGMSSPDAISGACSRECSIKLIVFLAVLFVVILAESLCLTPITMLLLKLIDKPLQPFALGILRMANILLAYIPAPIILGPVIDKTCVLWSTSIDCLDSKGSCLEYDANYLHYILFGTSLGIKVVSSFLLVIFSIYIHKSYVLKRRYQNSVTLNHDLTSVLSSKQKYAVDGIVTEIEDDNEIRNSNRFKRKKEKNTVILKNITRFNHDNDNNFTSFERSETPDFYLKNL